MRENMRLDCDLLQSSKSKLEDSDRASEWREKEDVEKRIIRRNSEKKKLYRKKDGSRTK